VLAGGAGRRIGGRDKALLFLGGQTLLARAVANLAAQCRPVAISYNRGTSEIATLGFPVLPDQANDSEPQGPLAGILAGLAWAGSGGARWLVTAPVDAPFLPADFVARLYAAASGPTVPVLAASSDGRLHPVVALWPVSAKDRLTQAFAAGERKLERVASGLGAQTVQFTDVPSEAFLNINTPLDLAAAEARLNQR
jgi:molybdenum cofactor guanylyltransferase